ncbi:galactoside-binding lectin [Ostertagia ostertagi]
MLVHGIENVEQPERLSQSVCAKETSASVKMHSVHSPTVPSAIPIREKLHVGSKIDVHGKVNHGHHKNFSVELLSGPHIVLHINFRFQHDHEVVRHHNPLHHDDQFHLHIHAHQDYFEIDVNGQQLAHFPHRFPMESVQALGLKGDVVVERVDFSGFHFGVDWKTGEHNYGHAGYTAYGSEHYEPPTFHAAHAYNAIFLIAILQGTRSTMD